VIDLGCKGGGDWCILVHFNTIFTVNWLM